MDRMPRLPEEVNEQLDAVLGVNSRNYEHYRERIRGGAALMIAGSHAQPSRVMAGAVAGSPAVLIWLEDGWLLTVSLADEVRLELLNPALVVSGIITIRDVVGARAIIRRNGADLFEIEHDNSLEWYGSFAAAVMSWASICS